MFANQARQNQHRPTRRAGRLALHAGALTMITLPCALLCAALAADTPTSQPAETRQTPTRDATPFQPGVSIDWQQRAVLVDTHIVLRAGALEFLACRPGKEHESIVRCDAPAMHIYMALGLIGLTPGQPPRWNETHEAFDPPDRRPGRYRL